MGSDARAPGELRLPRRIDRHLRDKDDATDHEAASILRLLVDWAESQFRQIDRKDAAGLAEGLIGGLQGAALLTNALRDPDIMTRYARRFDRWIESSSSRAQQGRTKSSPTGR